MFFITFLLKSDTPAPQIQRVPEKGALVMLSDILDDIDRAASVSVGHTSEIWYSGRVLVLRGRGAIRVSNKIERRVTRLQRQWMTHVGQCVVEFKRQEMTQFSRRQMLALATPAGFN